MIKMNCAVDSTRYSIGYSNLDAVRDSALDYVWYFVGSYVDISVICLIECPYYEND